MCEAEGVAAEIWREVDLFSTLKRERERKLPARGWAAAAASRDRGRWSVLNEVRRSCGEESRWEEMVVEVVGGRM